MRIAWLVIFGIVAPVINAAEWWSFENRAYYDPLIAGVRDAQISALVPARFDRMAMMVNPGTPRHGWDIDLGAELPIVGRESSASAGQIGEGEWGIGLWIPIDFHMIEDFRDQSAPIINTDYRFSGVLKVRRGFSRERALAVRLQYGHESTHLGDEFSIDAQRTFPRTFERINVSWQYLDLGALYTWQAGQTGNQVWNVRGGVTTTMPFRRSYYDTSPGSVTESRIGPVTASKNWWDPYFGLELNREKQFFRKKWGYYASTELRWRSIYDYHKRNAAQSEDRQTSINVVAGIRKSGTGNGIGRASPFVRYYHGVNPHGQFRNQKNYSEMGIGLRLVR